jgi:hypothetical protein
MAVAGGVSAAIAFGVSALSLRHRLNVPLYLGFFTGVPALVGGFARMMHEADDYGGRPKIRDMRKGMLKWGGIGFLLGGAALCWTFKVCNNWVDNKTEALNKRGAEMDAHHKKASDSLKQEKIDFLTKDCVDSPCRIVKSNGGTDIEVLSKAFAGESVIIDFSDAKAPKITRSKTELLNPPPPKAAPAAGAK